MKTKQEKREEFDRKLERATRLFSTLQIKLENGQDIKKKTILWTLANCAKNYSLNSEDVQYNACTEMYTRLGITYQQNPILAEKFKVMLRKISYKFYSKPRPQLTFNFSKKSNSQSF